MCMLHHGQNHVTKVMTGYLVIEGEGNACFSPIWIKMEQSILKIIYIILYIFEIHNKIFSVYNQ